MIISDLEFIEVNRIAKELYGIDVESIVNKFKSNELSSNNPSSTVVDFSKITKEILKEYKLGVFVGPENYSYGNCDNIDENKLEEFLVIQTLFNLSKNQSKTITFKKLITRSTYKDYDSNMYSYLRIAIAESPLADMLEIKKTDNNYVLKDFLADVTYDLINFIKTNPYRSGNKISFHSLCKHFNQDIYRYDFKLEEIQKKLKQKNFDNKSYIFSKSDTKEVLFKEEMLAYFLFERMYDVSNAIYLVKKLAETDYITDKKAAIKILAQTILIPNTAGKEKHIDHIFKMLQGKEYEILLSDISTQTLSQAKTHKTEASILQENLIKSEKYIRFLSFVYYPLLSAIFFSVCTDLCSDTVALEKQLYDFLIEKGFLDSYIEKFQTVRLFLDWNRIKTKGKNVVKDQAYRLSRIERNLLTDYYIAVKDNYYNENVFRHLKSLYSINPYQGENPHRVLFLYNTICIKTGVLNQETGSPFIYYINPPENIEGLKYEYDELGLLKMR